MPDEIKPIGSIYVFTPSSNFASRLLKQTLPNLRYNEQQHQTGSIEQTSNNDFLIVVILKFGNNSIHQ